MLYNKKDKLSLKSFFGAGDLLESLKINFKLPQNIIMLPFSGANKYIKSISKKTYSLLGSGDIDIISDKLAVLNNSGLGAPLTAVMAELIAELGGHNFVIMGIAGGLTPDLEIGDTVLCSGAFCDEGTSPNYIENSFAAADESLLKTLANIPHAKKAFTWTTDALFRETKEEVVFYAKGGAATVEMEAAALFAVAQRRELSAAGVFVISDLLAPDAWRHPGNTKNYYAILNERLAQAVEILK